MARLIRTRTAAPAPLDRRTGPGERRTQPLPATHPLRSSAEERRESIPDRRMMPKGYLHFPEAIPMFPTRKFHRWVRSFGVSRLARLLGHSDKVVQSWLHPRGGRLNRTRPFPPRLTTAWIIIRLSRRHRCGVGPLEYCDLYGKP